MLLFQASPKAYGLGIGIIIADRLEQMLSAVSLQLIRCHHQAVRKQPSEVENARPAIDPG